MDILEHALVGTLATVMIGLLGYMIRVFVQKLSTLGEIKAVLEDLRSDLDDLSSRVDRVSEDLTRVSLDSIRKAELDRIESSLRENIVYAREQAQKIRELMKVFRQDWMDAIKVLMDYVRKL